jgi:hypothetical protein
VNVVSGWRAVLWVVAVLLLAGLLLAAFVSIAVFIAICAGVAWFSLVLVPRMAQRLRIPELVISIALLPGLAAAGFALVGLNGALAGCAVWAVGVALPGAALWWIRRRVLQRTSGASRLARVRVIDA